MPRPDAPLPPAKPASGGGQRAWLAALLVAACVAAYLPTLRNGFVWDDDTFLTKNALIKAPDGLYRFWFTTQPLDYWPVTSSTLWFEWRLWGTHAVGYHATNLALHLGEVLLLWGVLRRLRVPGAWLAALLFAVHPVNVESVAWVAQRKNLTAMLFYLLSVHGFLRTQWYEKGLGLGGCLAPIGAGQLPRPDSFYWLSLLAFILAMLSKGSVAPLPLVLLGVIAWRRRVTPGDVARLAPFLLSAAGLVAVNIWFQTHGTHEAIRSADPIQRLLGAAAAIWFYLSKAIAPANLTFVYPLWSIDPREPLWWLPLLAAIGTTAALWLWAHRGGSTGGPARAALFAWGYFCVMLLPVLGFTDVYFMRYSLVADHYQHLAIIGLLALAAAGWESLRRRPLAAPWAWGAAALVVGACVSLTWRQAESYRDEETLYRATLARSPGAWMVYNNLGFLESGTGRKAEAARDYEQALRLNPHFAEAHLNRGQLSFEQGRFGEAIGDFTEALRERPDYPQALYNLGNCLHGLGRNPEAVEDYERALRIRPDYTEAENNLGVALADLGRNGEAMGHYERSIQLDPGYAPAHYNLANLLGGQGRADEAVAQYEEAIRLKPDYADAEINLGFAFQRAGRLPEAVTHYERAVQLRPADVRSRNNLGVALAISGRLDEAQAQFEEVLRLSPGDASAHQNLARVRGLR